MYQNLPKVIKDLISNLNNINFLLSLLAIIHMHHPIQLYITYQLCFIFELNLKTYEDRVLVRYTEANGKSSDLFAQRAKVLLRKRLSSCHIHLFSLTNYMSDQEH